MKDIRQAWNLKPDDSKRINCACGSPAKYGYTMNGGAPFFYDCGRHVPKAIKALANKKQVRP